MVPARAALLKLAGAEEDAKAATAKPFQPTEPLSASL
jgi:hypothetical protein